MKIALGYGWVDDRIKRINDLTFRRKFIPRRDGSLWTEAQRTIVDELTKLGQMEKPGLEAVARAKLDGSWASAQSSPASDAMLETFTSVLRPYEPAFSRFLRLPPSSQRTYAVGYCSAKRPDTRARRLSEAVEKLNSEAAARGSRKSPPKSGTARTPFSKP